MLTNVDKLSTKVIHVDLWITTYFWGKSRIFLISYPHFCHFFREFMKVIHIFWWITFC